MTVAGISYVYNVSDPLVASEAEVVELIDEQAASKEDVNHIVNIMVDEQVGDAQAAIVDIEDKIDAGKGTAADRRKLQRLERDIASYKKNYLPDPHPHGDIDD